MDDNRKRCEQCRNSRLVLTELKELPLCTLPKKLVWACLTGRDDRFTAKGDNDGKTVC